MTTQEQQRRLRMARAMAHEEEKLNMWAREMTRAGEHLVLGRDNEAASKLIAVLWLLKEQQQHLESFIADIRINRI